MRDVSSQPRPGSGHRPPAHTARTRGMTLIELLVTLAVAAIILTVGVPSFRDLMQDIRATTVTNRLMASIQHTRSEAVRRGMPVTLCASDDGATCTNVAPTDSADFSQGWIVVSGYPGDPGSELLRVHSPDVGDIDIPENLSNGHSLTYSPTGETRAPGGAFIAGNLQICHDGRDRRVIISKTGRPRVAKQACDD
ncbi:GspH/FimT family pseudopilin [Algiphilus aromaticivorans]|uniref:GspH/FimT family pseudopilin n=1 Tax=Algiphilus aromaticivorans TaxID=382454 RepID=UPI000A02C35A|nr:GspH/FimT family pseudopilin [Algiphilus aromaticivorans]